MELEISLPCTKKKVTGPYTQPDKSSQQLLSAAYFLRTKQPAWSGVIIGTVLKTGNKLIVDKHCWINWYRGRYWVTMATDYITATTTLTIIVAIVPQWHLFLLSCKSDTSQSLWIVVINEAVCRVQYHNNTIPSTPMSSEWYLPSGFKTKPEACRLSLSPYAS